MNYNTVMGSSGEKIGDARKARLKSIDKKKAQISSTLFYSFGVFRVQILIRAITAVLLLLPIRHLQLYRYWLAPYLAAQN